VTESPATDLLPVLLARWEARAFLQNALESAARDRLADELAAEELEIFIEQQLITEQTELLLEFFWTLEAVGCQHPDRMATWIERHNGLMTRLRAELDPPAGPEQRHPGPQQKRKLWRLQSAHFSAKARSACCARLNGSVLVLSLKDLERFMALHMDPTLCRDRLDALVRVMLLEDKLQPNLRLFSSTANLIALVTATLKLLRQNLEPSDDTKP